ncbi:MAG: Inhibitor of kappaB kinase gamma-like protein [Pedosphaera sp.]|nr:Inhibitor of kappaB kinase gamma-like protein [Pedosphaera sp.]
MSSFKELKQAEKSAAQQQQLLSELNTLARQIERCAETVAGLQAELAAINAKYPGTRTTREDIAFLTDLLKCANKKLGWEKQLASLRKRTPELMEKMSMLLNDPKNPPAEQVRMEMLQTLQGIQAAMERLQSLDMS